MRIAFLCGSLEPGRDGVGDYVRTLAGELALQGYEVAAVALNDHWCTKEQAESQSENNSLLSLLRIPARWHARKRYDLAARWIEDFDPDWLSIQFVPYAFHARGLPFGLLFHLKRLAQNRQVQVMFHETWVGEDYNNNIKLRFIAALQKHLVRRMVASLHPEVMHTHLPVYQQALAKLGLQVKCLPLFSNIKVAKPVTASPEGRAFRIAFFSQVGNDKPVMSFLSALLEQALARNLTYQVLVIGGRKEPVANFVGTIRKLPLYQGRVTCTGFLHAEKISGLLQECSLGLTPVPRHGLGKSGSVSAFLAHGIPVAAPNVNKGHSPSEIGFFSETMRSAILTSPDLDKLKEATAMALNAAPSLHVGLVAKTFISDLQG